MITTYIGIGSNILPEKHVKIALDELAQLGKISQISTIYEAEPVGFLSTNFFNLVVELKVSSSLFDLAVQLRDIEIKWGRQPQAKKCQDRTLDLDILLYGEEISSDYPKLPREDLFKFAFVILPMTELNPNLIVPGTKITISEIWDNFTNDHNLKPISLN